MKENIKETKPVSLKKRIARTHSKAEFVGMLYLIATIFLAAVAFFPMLYGTSVGDMWVKTFWKPFLELKNIKASPIAVSVNVFVALIYAVMLLTLVINVIKSLSRLSRLFKKKASRVNGYNRNLLAMERMGKIFSGTYCVFIAFPFMIHLISGAGFSNLFYIAVAIGLIFHFWCGLVGGNVSWFTTGDTLEEEKRLVGRWAPFFRNLAQLVFVGLIMYFISRTNLMLNALKWMEKGAFTELFKAKMDVFVYGVIPFVQLLACVWTLVLLKHATADTEFNRYGKEGDGMKNFRIFSIFLLVTSAALFILLIVASKKRDGIVPSMGTLYIAVIALAAMIEEFCMCRLPNVKGKVEEPVGETLSENEDELDFDPDSYNMASADRVEESPAAAAQETPANVPAMYHVPLQCITQPAVFMQPNGQPVMVMPMIAGPQMMPPAPMPAANAMPDGNQPAYGYAYNNPYMNPYPNPYGYGNQEWVNGRPYRPFNPYQYVQEPTEEPLVTEAKTEEPAATVESVAPAAASASSEAEKKTEEAVKAPAADKKARRAEAAMAKKETRTAAERAAVERALAEKWMRKAKQPVTEETGIAAAAAPAETPVMPAPAAETAAEAPVHAEEAKTSAEKAETKALVPAYAPAQEPLPREAVMETYAYQQPRKENKLPAYPEADDLTEDDLSKPLPPKKWSVTCPDCATKLTVKEGAFAYRCPECGGVFQLRKIFRSKQNQISEENK